MLFTSPVFVNEESRSLCDFIGINPSTKDNMIVYPNLRLSENLETLFVVVKKILRDDELDFKFESDLDEDGYRIFRAKIYVDGDPFLVSKNFPKIEAAIFAMCKEYIEFYH